MPIVLQVLPGGGSTAAIFETPSERHARVTVEVQIAQRLSVHRGHHDRGGDDRALPRAVRDASRPRPRSPPGSPSMTA